MQESEINNLYTRLGRLEGEVIILKDALRDIPDKESVAMILAMLHEQNGEIKEIHKYLNKGRGVFLALFTLGAIVATVGGIVTQFLTK